MWCGGSSPSALAGHSVARIARALNDAGVACPSVSGPGRNPHRPGTGWTLGMVTTILQNPRYTGLQVWNRQRTDKDLADPGDVSLGQPPPRLSAGWRPRSRCGQCPRRRWQHAWLPRPRQRGARRGEWALGLAGERAHLLRCLDGLAGIRVVPGAAASFVLLDTGIEDM